MHPNLDPGLLRAARAALSFRTQAFIDGKHVPNASGKTYTSVNPANGKPLAEIADCGPEDVEAAVRAARRAFQGRAWSKRKPGDRKHVMLKFVELLEKNALELALLDCLDAGKPIYDCVNIDVPDTIDCIRWHAELIDKLYERTSPSDRKWCRSLYASRSGSWPVSCHGTSRSR